MRVFVVDDAIFMRRMLSDILEEGGYTVCGEATTGKEAMARYKDLKPDLVTMDIIMPDMSGVEAVKELKKIYPKAKILMVSTMGQQAFVLEAVQAGAIDYIVKPFHPSKVLESIENIIEK